MTTRLLIALIPPVLLIAGCGKDRANPSPTPSAKQEVDATLQAFADSPLSSVPSFVREDPPSNEPDCSGVLELRDVAAVGNRRVKGVGKFAAGSMVGSSFTPIIYFETLAAARRCARDLEVREWSDKRGWVSK